MTHYCKLHRKWNETKHIGGSDVKCQSKKKLKADYDILQELSVGRSRRSTIHDNYRDCYTLPFAIMKSHIELYYINKIDRHLQYVSVPSARIKFSKFPSKTSWIALSEIPTKHVPCLLSKPPSSIRTEKMDLHKIDNCCRVFQTSVSPWIVYICI